MRTSKKSAIRGQRSERAPSLRLVPTAKLEIELLKRAIARTQSNLVAAQTCVENLCVRLENQRREFARRTQD